jgi:ornithine cyclodeaminase/alanine dehydrogenase
MFCVFDQDEARARAFAEDIGKSGARRSRQKPVSEAVDSADICSPAPPPKQPVLTNELSLAGCFVAAVGADNPEKWEIAPALNGNARGAFLVDDIEQCASGADLDARRLTGRRRSPREDVQCRSCGPSAAGRKSGRENGGRTLSSISSGSGVQDVAAAWLAYDGLRPMGRGSGSI